MGETSPCPACGYDSAQKVTRHWGFCIPIEAKSGNQTGSSGRGRSGWQYKKFRKAVAIAVGQVAFSKGTLPTKAKAKRRVWITRLWGKGKRGFDTDNLVWGMKGVFDEFKKLGWIVEDSPKWVDRIYRQEKAPDGVACIEVRIEELG